MKAFGCDPWVTLSRRLWAPDPFEFDDPHFAQLKNRIWGRLDRHRFVFGDSNRMPVSGGTKHSDYKGHIFEQR